MKKIILVALIGTVILPVTSCSKKKSGICYCTYVSGDKKEFDLTGISRDKAEDSCNRVLDGYANAFGGECSLK